MSIETNIDKAMECLFYWNETEFEKLTHEGQESLIDTIEELMKREREKLKQDKNENP
jgi:hypothetical protein